MTNHLGAVWESRRCSAAVNSSQRFVCPRSAASINEEDRSLNIEMMEGGEKRKHSTTNTIKAGSKTGPE